MPAARRPFTCATTVPGSIPSTRTSCSGRFSGCTPCQNSRVPASALRPSSASSIATAARSGRKARPTAARAFSSRSTDMNEILLVEDNPDDVELTLRAFRKSNIANEIVVARDGLEALDYLFCTGTHSGRTPSLPQVMLLDLKMPRVDGLHVLERVRAHPRTRLLPVVILTSSIEEQDLLNTYSRGANSYIRKPVDFQEFVDAVRQLGLYWLLLNQPPPSTPNP